MTALRTEQGEAPGGRGPVPACGAGQGGAAAGARSERSPLLNAASAREYEALLHDVVDALGRRFRTVEAPVSGVSRSDLEEQVARIDLDGPAIGHEAALREAEELYTAHAVWFHHPAYAAHLNCPVAVPAVAAEAMLAAVNTSVDTYDQSTVATLMERRLIAWAAEQIGFAAGDGVFTSGGTHSNLQALHLAREAALRRAASRTEELPRLRVLATAESHFSVGRAAHLLGLGADAVLSVAADAEGRMDPEALDAALAGVEEDGARVMAVVVTAGTTDRGVIDPIAAVARRCESAGLWLHVDAAYGGGLLVSPRRRHLLAGIERANSVTIDFHKTYFQPVSSSALVVREPRDLAATAHHADYLNPVAEAGRADSEPNQVDKSLQTTRRFDALKLWTTLRALGAERVGEMVDAVCDLAEYVRLRLEADPEFEVLGRSDLSTVLFRFCPAGADEAAVDALVPEIRSRLFASGRAVVARTVVAGMPWLKVTLLNPEATLADLDVVLEHVRTAGREALREGCGARSPGRSAAELAMAGGERG
ncbi:pyridoxal-dependent decarboxylase [Brevibacterium sp.]|uniref:pyridoxal phosphate-dependent decarboxylase family protein n=1 Tax=Brevibacterium sp. TaxID=1701 RepID=UPI0025B818F4|nr:pyridoxal-dependent decarboxylase [Brevibacterium sp.]